MQPGRTLYFPVQLIISLGEICPKLTSVSPCVDIIIKHIKFSDLIEQIELFLFFFASLPLFFLKMSAVNSRGESVKIFLKLSVRVES